MMTYLITTKHYLKRSFSKPIEVALMTLLPVGIIIIMAMINLNIFAEFDFDFTYRGYNVVTTVTTFFIVLMFQFMSGVYAGEFIFHDLRGANRWRLKASPVPTSAFVFGAITASMIFSLVSAAFVLVIVHVFFDVYVGNMIVIAPVIALAALMSQFMGIIIAMFVKKSGAIDGIIIVISFAMSSLVGGFFITIPAPEFVRNYIIPTGVAFRAIATSSLNPVVANGQYYTIGDSFLYVGILAGATLVFGIAAFIIARRRPT